MTARRSTLVALVAGLLLAGCGGAKNGRVSSAGPGVSRFDGAHVSFEFPAAMSSEPLVGTAVFLGKARVAEDGGYGSRIVVSELRDAQSTFGMLVNQESLTVPGFVKRSSDTRIRPVKVPGAKEASRIDAYDMVQVHGRGPLVPMLDTALVMQRAPGHFVVIDTFVPRHPPRVLDVERFAASVRIKP